MTSSWPGTAYPGDDAGIEDGGPQPYERVMIVLEDDPPAQVAVDVGLALARVHGAQAVFLHLVREDIGPVLDASAIAALSDPLLVRAVHDRAQRCVSQALAGADAAGVTAEVHSHAASCGAPGVAEAAVAYECDVIVIASDGHNAVIRLISGSLIPGLITASPVPLLVCREASTTAGETPASTSADQNADRTP